MTELCGACSGSGYYDDTGSPACGACEGKGHVEPDSYEWESKLAQANELIRVLNIRRDELNRMLERCLNQTRAQDPRDIHHDAAELLKIDLEQYPRIDPGPEIGIAGMDWIRYVKS